MPDIENLLNIEDEVTQVLSDLGVNEKLNEMDDFMNQNDLKVQITNENAVVTGLVTYTCTVKDKNNTALANKVVEWYKGTTLIGIDATDSNGVSTFSHRVTEADIYDVHAIVRGTHAGDDIRMFVKDKNNIISHNNWSGTDYLKNISIISIGSKLTAESSTDYNVNGERSYKLTNPLQGGDSVILEKILGDFKQGTSITLSSKLFVKNTRSVLYLQGGVEGSSASNLSTVSLSENNSFGDASINIVLESDLDYLQIAVMVVDEGVTYIDDICLKEV